MIKSSFLFPDVEIAKLEKRRMRYRERSPSPTQLGSKSSLPTLPIPSDATKLPPDSNAKLMFFTMLGLNRTREDEKKGNKTRHVFTKVFCHILD